MRSILTRATAVVAAALMVGAAIPASSAAAATDAPFLFNYTYNGHLKIGGGYFTAGRNVYLLVNLNDGTRKFSKKVTAHDHSITPGGAIYVETTIAAPCAWDNNGYARAYDYATRRWSPRLQVGVCQNID